MALSDRLSTPRPSFHGTPCSIGTLLDQLDGDELAAFKTMLESRDWNATMVYDACRDEGYVIGRQSVNRHRRGACRCFPRAAV